MFFMSGVLRQLVRPQKKALNQKAMELEAAREILAEVFGVRLSEVDEMIKNRFQAGEEKRSMDGELWPQELWVEG
jgi:uncharacterized tellurite resistance protein B-like protein